METQTVTAHIPKDLVAKVDAMAALFDRPRGWAVKQALADWVVNQEEHQRMIAEARADVAAGRVIDHGVMLAWADSLSTETPLPAPLL